VALVESVTTYVLEADLHEPWDFGIEPYATSTCVVVAVTTADGLVGHGEAIARKSPHATAQVVTDLLAPLVLGREVQDTSRVWIKGLETLRRWGHSRGFLLEALSGLDIALWDLRARQLDIPVGALLPNGVRRKVATYASSVYFQETVEDAVRVARETVSEGHRSIKIKIGHRPDQGGLERDIETVLAIRAELGDGITLMLDANGAYRFPEAARLVQALAPATITWLEEPFPPDDLDGYGRLARTSPIPIAAGESEFSVFGFRDLIGRGAIAYAQPDVARCGGISGFLQVLDYCFCHRIPVCPHTGFSGGINNLVSIQMAATALEVGPLEHMIIGNPLRDLFTEPLPDPVEGVLEVPDGIGLGQDIAPEKVRRFAVGERQVRA